MAIIEDLEEVAPLAVGDRRHREVVDHQHIGASDLGQEPRIRSVGPREHKLREQARGASVDRAVALAARLLGARAGNVGLADAGRAGDEHVLVLDAQRQVASWRICARSSSRWAG